MLKEIGLSESGAAFWLDRRVLVTGHTGFLGSWIAVWLSELGADLVGFARRPPVPASLFALAGLDQRMTSLAGDIRDRARVAHTVTSLAPEIIVHLAGRCATTDGLKRPLDSFDSNVTGTLNILHAACRTPGLRAIVVVTAAGDGPSSTVGSDPASASLACAEIIAETFRRCYLQAADGIGLATLRLPEIVGGGDFGRDRLVPGVVRASVAGRHALPATGMVALPLLHVLDALRHCLELAEALVRRPQAYARIWSSPAAPPAPWAAASIAAHVAARLDGRPPPVGQPRANPSKAVLRLDRPGVVGSPIARRNAALPSPNGAPLLDVATALDWTVEGYRRLETDGHAAFITDQITRFTDLASARAPEPELPFDPPTPPAKASHASLSA